MNCEKCVEKIRKALENVAGLEEMKFDLDNKNIITDVRKKVNALMSKYPLFDY